MQWVEPLLAGDRRAVARMISLAEDDPAAVEEAMRALYARTGRAHVVGITGAPGTGKSTLIASLVREWRRRGRTVGVVAVDPSSPFTGGALLGDRIRMQDLTSDQGVFVRSMASRGALGGLAEPTALVVSLLDAFGLDMVLVETVGVGQAEVEIAQEAHTVVVVSAPGLGDEVQALKAGLLEAADIVVVNKADRQGSEPLAAELLFATSPPSGALDGRPAAWHVPVMRTVATKGTGTAQLLDQLEAHRSYLAQSGAGERRLAAIAARRVERLAAGRLVARARERLQQSGEWRPLVEDVAARRLDPAAAADRLVAAATRR